MEKVGIILLFINTVNSSGVQNFAKPLTTCLHLLSPTSISSTNKLNHQIPPPKNKLKWKYYDTWEEKIMK